MALTNLERFGPPTNLNSVIKIDGGNTYYFTGSEYGAGAVITADSYDGIIGLITKGFVSGSHLTNGTLYEFSPYYVYGGTTGSVYVFKTR